MASPQREPSWSSIPDIALKIASFLEVLSLPLSPSLSLSLSRISDGFIDLDGEEKAAEVCSLGSCSRFWRGLCSSDFVWMTLAKRRWPILDLALVSTASSQIPSVLDGFDEGGSQEVSAEYRPSQGWREIYIHKHQSLAQCVSTVKEFVEQCTQNETLEVGYYLRAISDLNCYRLGFQDVQVFLFARSCSVLLNLVGLHYCLFWLEIAPSEVMEALCRSQVSGREVCVRWFILGRWFYGFRLQDEYRTLKISLGELVMDKNDEVLGVLNRGAVHEVIRVNISPVNPKTAAQSTLSELRARANYRRSKSTIPVATVEALGQCYVQGI